MAVEAAGAGFEGLDFDAFGVFPIVSLKNEKFLMNDGRKLGTSFVCYIQKSRPKYAIKTSLVDSDPRMEVIYSYDQVTDHRGRSVKEVIDDWARQGIHYKVTKYTEAPAVLENGDMVLLSIPPTSNTRLAAALGKICAQVGGWDKIPSVPIRVSVGPEVLKAAMPFFPWQFDLA